MRYRIIIMCLSALLLLTVSVVTVTLLLKKHVPLVNPEGLSSTGCILGTLRPDETNCTKFYICTAHGLQTFSCSLNLHFNPVTNNCDSPDAAGCSEIISTTQEILYISTVEQSVNNTEGYTYGVSHNYQLQSSKNESVLTTDGTYSEQTSFGNSALSDTLESAETTTNSLFLYGSDVSETKDLATDIEVPVNNSVTAGNLKNVTVSNENKDISEKVSLQDTTYTINDSKRTTVNTLESSITLDKNEGYNILSTTQKPVKNTDTNFYDVEQNNFITDESTVSTDTTYISSTDTSWKDSNSTSQALHEEINSETNFYNASTKLSERDSSVANTSASSKSHEIITEELFTKENIFSKEQENNPTFEIVTVSDIPSTLIAKTTSTKIHGTVANQESITDLKNNFNTTETLPVTEEVNFVTSSTENSFDTLIFDSLSLNTNPSVADEYSITEKNIITSNDSNISNLLVNNITGVNSTAYTVGVVNSNASDTDVEVTETLVASHSTATPTSIKLGTDESNSEQTTNQLLSNTTDLPEELTLVTESDATDAKYSTLHNIENSASISADDLENNKEIITKTDNLNNNRVTTILDQSTESSTFESESKKELSTTSASPNVENVTFSSTSEKNEQNPTQTENSQITTKFFLGTVPNKISENEKQNIDNILTSNDTFSGSTTANEPSSLDDTTVTKKYSDANQATISGLTTSKTEVLSNLPTIPTTGTQNTALDPIHSSTWYKMNSTDLNNYPTKLSTQSTSVLNQNGANTEGSLWETTPDTSNDNKTEYTSFSSNGTTSTNDVLTANQSQVVVKLPTFFINTTPTSQTLQTTSLNINETQNIINTNKENDERDHTEDDDDEEAEHRHHHKHKHHQG